jgi:hypothetical protein
MACADGSIDSQEAERLADARKKYGVSLLQHNLLLADVMRFNADAGMVDPTSANHMTPTRQYPSPYSTPAVPRPERHIAPVARHASPASPADSVNGVIIAF